MKRTKQDKRPSSDNFVDVHIFVVPHELWMEKYRTTYNNSTLESVSAGFVRASPSLSMSELRIQVKEQLGGDVIPEDYVFLRCVGRCLAIVSKAQEFSLKVKHFLPPVVSSPEIFVLFGTHESLSYSLTSSLLNGSDGQAECVSGYLSNSREIQDESRYSTEYSANGSPDIYTNDMQDTDKADMNDIDKNYIRDRDKNDVRDRDKYEMRDRDKNDVRDRDKNDVRDMDKNDVRDRDENDIRDMDKNEVRELVNNDMRDVGKSDMRDMDKKDMRDESASRGRRVHFKSSSVDQPTSKVEDKDERYNVDTLNSIEATDEGKEMFHRAKRKVSDDNENMVPQDLSLQQFARRSLDEQNLRQGAESTSSWNRDLQEHVNKTMEFEESSKDVKKDVQEIPKLEIGNGLQKKAEHAVVEVASVVHSEVHNIEQDKRESLTEHQSSDNASEQTRWKKPQSETVPNETTTNHSEIGQKLTGRPMVTEQDDSVDISSDNDANIALREKQAKPGSTSRSKPKIYSSSREFTAKENKQNTSEKENDLGSTLADKENLVLQLQTELSAVRNERSNSEKAREQLLKKAKNLQHQNNQKRNRTRNIWKKQYFEEKKTTVSLEERCNQLRYEVDVLHKKLLSSMDAKDQGVTSSIRHEGDPDKVNNKILLTRKEDEVGELKRRVEEAKIKLGSEMKLRDTAQKELKHLRDEVIDKKINATLVKNSLSRLETRPSNTQT